MTETARAPVKRDTTLSKGLSILEALSESAAPVGVSDIARQLNLTKSNTYRLLQTLTDMGYVAQPDGRNYAATSKIWRAASRWSNNLSVRNVALPDMIMLAQETGETVYLGVLEQAHVVYIERVDGGAAQKDWSTLGSRVPWHCSAMGRAILAHSGDDWRDFLETPCSRYTSQTLTGEDELRSALMVTRRVGYAVDKGEFRDGVHSFAIAVGTENAADAAALAVSVPKSRLDADKEVAIVEALKTAALSLGQKYQDLNWLGH